VICAAAGHLRGGEEGECLQREEGKERDCGNMIVVGRKGGA